MDVSVQVYGPAARALPGLHGVVAERHLPRAGRLEGPLAQAGHVPKLVDLREAGAVGRRQRRPVLVVVARDQAHVAAVDLPPEGVGLLDRDPEREVAQHPEGVGGRHAAVDGGDELAVHVAHVQEGALGEPDDVVVPQVQVAREEDPRWGPARMSCHVSPHRTGGPGDVPPPLAARPQYKKKARQCACSRAEAGRVY